MFQRELKLAKAQKQTKIDNESLFQREMKLEKAMKQTKSDNESLFQREMKLTKVQKQTKIDNELLFKREMKLAKDQKQTKSDNELLFQREMKLWQDKKDLRKERKSFDEAMAVGRRELQNGKEEAGVSQQEVKREKRFSRIMCKAPPNVKWMRFCFGQELEGPIFGPADI